MNGAENFPSTHRIPLPDARHLARTVAGDGSPAVFLESGLGVDGSAWDEVQQALGRVTRVVRVDRAGVGASDPAPSTPRTLSHLGADLHALLHTPGVRDGPCVLVGHSFGGLLARWYAHEHPRDVAALVLVEAMHEDQFDRLGARFPPPAAGDGPALAAARAFWQERWRDPAHNAEGIDLPRSLAQARAATRVAMPLAVISAGAFLDTKLFGREAGAVLQSAWLGLQGELARLGRPVEHLYLPASGHFVMRDAAQAVVATVARTIARLRPDRSG
jgi:pimeloyl-ACP methyl ester carboxylesterase